MHAARHMLRHVRSEDWASVSYLLLLTLRHSEAMCVSVCGLFDGTAATSGSRLELANGDTSADANGKTNSDAKDYTPDAARASMATPPPPCVDGVRGAVGPRVGVEGLAPRVGHWSDVVLVLLALRAVEEAPMRRATLVDAGANGTRAGYTCVYKYGIT